MRHSHSRWRPLAGTLLLLLADKLHQAMGGGNVATDKSCYHLDEDIVVSFYTEDPGEGDWVGVYPFNTVSGGDEPSMWLWTCGTQRCWGKANQGRLTFGGSGAVADNEDQWPLDPGTYVAVLGRDVRTDGSESTYYEIFAYSGIFRVKVADGLCGSPQPTSHPPSTTSGPGPAISTGTHAPLEAYPTTTYPTTTRPPTSFAATPKPTHSNTPDYPTTTTTVPTYSTRGILPIYHPAALSPTNYAKTLSPTNYAKTLSTTNYAKTLSTNYANTLSPTNYAKTNSSSTSPTSRYAATANDQPRERLPTSTPRTTISPTYYSTEPSVTARPTNASITEPTKAPTSLARVIEAAKKEIKTLIMALPSLSALFLRLIFYDCLGGCDGCIDHSNADNGLPVLNFAVDILKPTVEKYEPLGLTRPDIWVLASSTGVEVAMLDSDFVPIPFTTVGRQPCDPANMTKGPTATACDPNLGTDQLVDFFQAHFGFSPQETAAIMGAHTIGVMRKDNFGFDSPNGWTQNNLVFDNGYHKELVGPGTTLEEQFERAPNWQQRFKDNGGLGSGVPSVFQWEGFPNNERIVMLNADIALVRQLHGGNKAVDGQVSCPFVSRGGGGPTCPMARSDLFIQMVKYRNDNKIFLEDFRDAFIKMTQKGYRVDSSTCDSDGICQLVEE